MLRARKLSARGAPSRPFKCRGYRGLVRRRPTIPLLVAFACLLAMAVTGLLALDAPGAHERDAAMLHGFVALDRPRVHDVVVVLAHLADPLPYLLVGGLLIAWALLRRLVWRAGFVAALLVVTGASTQAIKHLLAQPRFESWLGVHQVGAASWPSGHSTAAMTLALCAVLVAPVALRPAVAVLGGAFAAGVGYAVLVLAWHFPSDVLGGFLMAGTWAALAGGGPGGGGARVGGARGGGAGCGGAAARAGERAPVRSRARPRRRRGGGARRRGVRGRPPRRRDALRLRAPDARRRRARAGGGRRRAGGRARARGLTLT